MHKIRPFLDLTTTKLLAISLILPRLNYWNSSFSHITTIHQSILQNYSIRLNLPKYSRTHIPSTQLSTHRWKRKSWSATAQEECSKSGLNNHSRTPLQGPGLAPWLWVSNKRLSIHTSLMNNSTKTDSKELTSLALPPPFFFTCRTNEPIPSRPDSIN